MPKIYDVLGSEENPIITQDGLTDYDHSVATRIQEVNKNVDNKISELRGEIQTAGGNVNYYIKATCTEEYNGYTLTATSELDESIYTAEVENGKALIEVGKPGKYIVTNDLNANQDEAFVGDPFIDEVGFSVFKATIKVTIPEAIIGSTITATAASGGKVLEQVANSTTVTFNVTTEGKWNIGIKGTPFTKQVNINSETEFSVTISSSEITSTIPMITVSTNNKMNGETIKCTKGSETLEKQVVNKQVVFILPSTGNWQLSCDTYPAKKVDVNVETSKEYTTRFAIGGILGVRVNQAESNPKTRVEPQEDLIGLTPVTVNTSNGTVNYGDMQDTWIFEKMYPAMVKFDGTIDYKLDPNNYAQKLEGGASDVGNINYQGNAMCIVETLYYKAYTSGGYEYMLLSDEPEDGFEPIAHKRSDGSVMDYVGVAMFKGSYDSSNRLRSISGQKIRNNTNFTDFVTAAQKNGTNYNIEYHSLITILDLIYLILFQNDNSQVAARGRDYNGGGNPSGNEMSISTGFANAKGPIAYDTASQGLKMMHIEDHWGNNLYWWMNGMLFQNNKTYIKMQPPYSSTAVSGYTEVPNGGGGLSGYISTSNANTNYGRIPNGANGSDSTYQCDNFNFNSNTNGTLYVCYRAYHGVWYRLNLTAPSTLTNLGAALSCEQPKVA